MFQEVDFNNGLGSSLNTPIIGLSQSDPPPPAGYADLHRFQGDKSFEQVVLFSLFSTKVSKIPSFFRLLLEISNFWNNFQSN